MRENDITGTQRELHKDMQQEVDVKHGTDSIDSADVLNVVDKMNEFMDPLRTNLKFELHEQLDEYYVQVINPFTNEVIKEIPPKKMLDMRSEEHTSELQSRGHLVCRLLLEKKCMYGKSGEYARE